MKHSKIVAAGEPLTEARATGLHRVESLLEAVLFGSRWLMAPSIC